MDTSFISYKTIENISYKLALSEPNKMVYNKIINT